MEVTMASDLMEEIKLQKETYRKSLHDLVDKFADKVFADAITKAEEGKNRDNVLSYVKYQCETVLELIQKNFDSCEKVFCGSNLQQKEEAQRKVCHEMEEPGKTEFNKRKEEKSYESDMSLSQLSSFHSCNDSVSSDGTTGASSDSTTSDDDVSSNIQTSDDSNEEALTSGLPNVQSCEKKLTFSSPASPSCDGHLQADFDVSETFSPGSCQVNSKEPEPIQFNSVRKLESHLLPVSVLEKGERKERNEEVFNNKEVNEDNEAVNQGIKEINNETEEVNQENERVNKENEEENETLSKENEKMIIGNEEVNKENEKVSVGNKEINKKNDIGGIGNENVSQGNEKVNNEKEEKNVESESSQLPSAIDSSGTSICLHPQYHFGSFTQQETLSSLSETQNAFKQKEYPESLFTKSVNVCKKLKLLEDPLVKCDNTKTLPSKKNLARREKILQYDSHFLLKLRTSPLSRAKPKGLLNVYALIKSTLTENVNSILDQLTEANVSTMQEEVISLGLISQMDLEELVNAVHARACFNIERIHIYGQFCKAISELRAYNHAKPADQQFQEIVGQMMVDKCKDEFYINLNIAFEDPQQKSAEIEAITPQGPKRETFLNARLEHMNSIRERFYGNIRFIGELVKQGLMTREFLSVCIQNLLKAENSITFVQLCDLLMSVREVFDRDVNEGKPQLTEYLNSMSKFAEGSSPFIKLKLQEIIDARQVGKSKKKPRHRHGKGESTENEVKPLHQSENPWKPQHKLVKSGCPAEKRKSLESEVLSIMNRITPTNFDRLAKEMQKLDIKTYEDLQNLVNIFFDKMAMEEQFVEVYAQLCKVIAAMRVPPPPESAITANQCTFRVMMLTKCQQEFETDKNIVFEDPEEKKKKMEAEMPGGPERAEEIQITLNQMKLRRQKFYGNIGFIGELFKLNMLTENIMHDCIFRLIKARDDGSLTALCSLLTSVGQRLDTDKAKKRMDQYFEHMSKLMDETNRKSTVKFVLRDVIDLRKNNWVPRKDQEGPRKIGHIYKDFIQEQASKQLLQSQPVLHHSDLQPSSRQECQDEKPNDGWNAVRPKLISIDASKMKLSKFSVNKEEISTVGGLTPHVNKPSDPDSDSEETFVKKEMMSETDMKQKAKSILTGYLEQRNIEETCSLVAELQGQRHLPMLVRVAVYVAMKKTNAERKIIVDLFKMMLSCDFLTLETFWMGLAEFCQEKPIFNKFGIWMAVAELVAPLIMDEFMSIFMLFEALRQRLPESKVYSQLMTEILVLLGRSY